ncbi:MAG: UbiD family decarboxylase, partial [Verrucomicrobiae bacterium]|nr:UbiD family decarboxylase [Verrucomicrobiae bacterium]
MAFESFRDFVNALDRAGELKRIARPVATELEITELADREMKSPGGGQALLLEQPTVNGVVSPFPVAINTMGSHKRMALSMGANSVDEVAGEMGALMKAKPPTGFKEALKLLGQALDLRHAKPKIVKSGPCKDVIHRLENSGESTPPAACPRSASVTASGLVTLPPTSPTPPTLANLPILKCWPLDGGRFITLPCVVTRDPDTGERNVGMYRIQIYDDRTTGMHWQLQKVGARHGRR